MERTVPLSHHAVPAATMPMEKQKSEQVPIVNFGRAGDGEHQAGEQTFVGVALRHTVTLGA